MANGDKSDTIKKKKKPTRRASKQATSKKRFLELLLDKKVLGNVSTAADLLNVNRNTLYEWRKKDAKFAKTWDERQADADELLADKAENALLGAIDAGNVTAIIFTLKNRRPGKWRDRFEHTGEGGGPIEYEYELSPEFQAAMSQFITRHDKPNKVDGKTARS